MRTSERARRTRRRTQAPERVRTSERMAEKKRGVYSATPPGTLKATGAPKQIQAPKRVRTSERMAEKKRGVYSATPPGTPKATGAPKQIQAPKRVRTSERMAEKKRGVYSATPPGAPKATGAPKQIQAPKRVRTSERMAEKKRGVYTATPPGTRQTHSQWACRPTVTVKASVRPDAKLRGRRSSLLARQQLMLPREGAAARRPLAVKPEELSGPERERERDESAALTHLPTGPPGRTDILITFVPNELTRKQLPHRSDSGPSPEKNPC